MSMQVECANEACSGTHATCAVCGKDDCAGLGYWACHADDDETPVHRGPCWRTYQTLKAEAKVLGLWESLYPGEFLSPAQRRARVRRALAQAVWDDQRRRGSRCAPSR